MNTIAKLGLAGAAMIGAAALAVSGFTTAEEAVPVSELQGSTHTHGLAVDKADPSKLLIAAHHGLYRADADGNAELVSPVQDLMGFNPHPSEPATLYASGHPAGGGNLGFIVSTDQGQSWKQISPGLNGPVDFHQMTVSPADPNTIYGAYGDIQVSGNSGETWVIAGPAPERLIDLAASATDADKLFAATETGLLVSTDQAKTWSPTLKGAPVTMVEVGPDGSVYAFVLGQGLMRSEQEDPLQLEPVNSQFGQGYLLHLAVDPTDPSRLFAATSEGEILRSPDRGATWLKLAS